MHVQVRLFAQLRERVGSGLLDAELEDGATVGDALRELAEHATLGDLLAELPVRAAVNREIAGEDTQLHPGDELALLPPVSGGAQTYARLTDRAIDAAAVTDLVRRAGAGAVVTFEGTVRDVDFLDYEAYREMAEQEMSRIVEACIARYGLQAAAAEHRVGKVALGEPGVVVAASAAHREEAFAGAREIIDRIKANAPIWKRELEGEQARWVEGRSVVGE